MKICEDCGKPIDEHKGWFWRHNYKDIEFYCYKCGKSHIGGSGDFGLRTDALWDPSICDGNRGAQDEQ